MRSRQGATLFAKVGCATCHTPKLGKVEGLYSDLLLHDLGPALGDVGQYGVFDPSSSEDEIVDDPASVADASNETGPMLPIQAPLPVVPPPTATASAEVVSPATPAPPSTPPSVVVSAPLAPPADTPVLAPGEPAPPSGPVARFSAPVAVSATFSGMARTWPRRTADQAAHERTGLAVRVGARLRYGGSVAASSVSCGANSTSTSRGPGVDPLL